jgi:hypothetical protein
MGIAPLIGYVQDPYVGFVDLLGHPQGPPVRNRATAFPTGTNPSYARFLCSRNDSLGHESSRATNWAAIRFSAPTGKAKEESKRQSIIDPAEAERVRAWNYSRRQARIFK